MIQVRPYGHCMSRAQATIFLVTLSLAAVPALAAQAGQRAEKARAKATPARQLLAQAAQPAPALPAPQDVVVPPAPRFDIERFDVQGNTLLQAQEVEGAVGIYTGKSKDFADVQRALESLQDRYRARGYGSVQVLLPEQELERGVIVLRVIEPKLGKITVEGNKFFDTDNIRRSIPDLQEGTTPNAVAIGQSARLANENASKRTSVLLRAGANEGEVDATIRVQDEKFWRANVSLDNTGSRTTGMYRLGLGFQHSNLFNRDHTVTVQYQLDPEPIQKADELKILGVGYRIPLYRYDASLDLLAGYSTIGPASAVTIPGTTTSLNFTGSGTIFGARYNYMLPRVSWLDDYDHRLSLGLDYKAFSNQVVPVTAGVAGASLTPDVTVYPLSLTYSGTKRMESAEFGFFGSVAHNIYPHGPDAYSEKFHGPTGARPNEGRPTYTIWRYGLNYVRAFASDVQLRGLFVGQWTRDALIPGEQFGIGGWDNVRGMQEREAANDRGYRATVELYTPDLGPKLQLEGARLRFLAFLDWASIRQNIIIPQNQCVASAACGLTALSAGVGMRMSLRQGVSLRLDYGQMLDAGMEGNRGDDRWHFGLAVAF
ncbi:MAG: ShlB/FhaC/HecB family hemolysin secretion/activation protein [Burkholderiales bacterium]|nr:ShlB/FhaC/HecB family hemolysin secretion/activation protein [Burkholderiales bacterium]